ncbi:MAG: hypothetical protein ACRECH_18595, partial [Nitrososphaerales archaeon]
EYPARLQHLFAIAPLETGDQSIGSSYGFWWQGSDASATAEKVITNPQNYSNKLIFETFSGLNTGYVVVWTQASKTVFSQGSDFGLATHIGLFYVYKLVNFIPSYATIVNGSGSAIVTTFEPEKIVVHLQNVSSGSDLLVKVEYFSNWQASTSYGGQIKATPANLTLPLDSVDFISIPLSKAGTYNITLNYVQTQADTVGLAITIFSLITFALGSLFAATGSRTRTLIADYLARVVRKTRERLHKGMHVRP